MNKNFKLTTKSKEQIITQYLTTNTNCVLLAKQYGVSGKTIQKLLKKKGIKINRYRKYTVNDNYFNRIDAEDKAYFLGLMYADGYNSEKKYGSYLVSLQLQDTDVDILRKFSDKTKNTRPLYFHKSNKKNWKDKYSVTIISQKVSEDLARLGCFNNKSLILKFPTEEQVPNYLLRHFIRGYMDGDGSFGRSQTKIYLDIASSLAFCEKLKQVLLNIGAKGSIHKNKSIYVYRVGWRSAKLVLDWLYKDAAVYMNRKYNKYLFLKENW